MAAGQQSLDSLLRSHSKRKTLRQQIDSASMEAEPGKAMPEDLPTVNIGCQKYVLEEHLANKNRKGRRSWIQGYGFFLTEISPDFKALQTYWACSKCDENGVSSLFVATNTTSPTEHLRRYTTRHWRDSFVRKLMTHTTQIAYDHSVSDSSDRRRKYAGSSLPAP
jgi:hypothetical protein